MKKQLALLAFSTILTCTAFAQKPAAVKVPGSCNMYLDEAKVTEVTLELALKWTALEPPMVVCDDGKIYSLEEFHVEFISLKPFMTSDFGIAQRGFPIMARKAVEQGKPGDAIVLKDATYLDENGNPQKLPIISIKLK